MSSKDFKKSVSPELGSKVRKHAGHGVDELPKIVSLFSGAGGLDLGFHLESFQVAIAFDSAAAAMQTHKRNFPKATTVLSDLKKIGAKGVVSRVSDVIPPGSKIGIIGGPPCQGFSRANHKAKSTDPRNRMPTLYVKIIEALQKLYHVDFVVFENVLGMKDRKHAATYRTLVASLKGLGFAVTEKELCALQFGVPQTRHRIILSALRISCSIGEIKPRRRKGPTSVREAIGKLPKPAFFSRDLDRAKIPAHPNHWTMAPKSARFFGSVPAVPTRSFKQLEWGKPSPTIAFGHREIHVHPSGTRRLSIYEAMLLQGFPKSFVLEGNLSEQVEQVSNAVPPPLARSVASAIRRTLRKR